MTAATLRLFALLFTCSACAFSLPAATLHTPTLASPVTKYTYDGFGNKVVQRDATPLAPTDTSRETKWEYDVMGRVTKRLLPKGQEERFTYDEVGNVAIHTNFNGQVVSYTYDALNRLKTKTLDLPPTLVRD